MTTALLQTTYFGPIPKEEQDKCLLDKMYAEREGIVYKAVKALQRVIANGYRFSEPHAVVAERDKYMTENNTVITFFNECMEKSLVVYYPDTTAGRIYNVYREWCKDNNNGFAKTAKEFREILSAHLGKTYSELTIHTKYGTHYRNLKLSEEIKQHYTKAFFKGSTGGDDDFLG